MRDSYRNTFARYLVALAICVVVALACALAARSITYAPLATLALTIISFCAVLLALVLTLVMVVMRRESADWRATCEPLLADYEASGDVDAFVAGYEDWRLGQHTAATRFSLLEEVCDRLARDGYEADAEVALSGLAAMARTPRLARRFRKTRDRCRREAAAAERA